MHVLVTGGAGYVGSNVVHALLQAGHDVTVVDDLSSGHRAAVPDGVRLLEGRCGDHAVLDQLAQRPDGVMHMAAKCSVGESMERPRDYYETNVRESLRLLDWMLRREVEWIIHSSTCAVYGIPDALLLDETPTPCPINAYGATKLAVDVAIDYYARAYGLGGTCMRYFNAAGAQPDGSLGEDKTPASNLIPRVLGVPLGIHRDVQIYGTDFDTPDGTGVRDYVHVSDLAAAHLAAMQRLAAGEPGGVYNLGTETGSSVLEVLAIAREVSGHDIPSVEVGARSGDPAMLVAASGRAHDELDWRPQRSDLRTIVEDAWRWHTTNPRGYGGGQHE
jgi:UDP-glucose 4-epimerase